MAKSKSKKTKTTPSKKPNPKTQTSRAKKDLKKPFHFGGVQAIEVGAIAGLLMVPQRSVAGGPCY